MERTRGRENAFWAALGALAALAVAVAGSPRAGAEILACGGDLADEPPVLVIDGHTATWCWNDAVGADATRRYCVEMRDEDTADSPWYAFACVPADHNWITIDAGLYETYRLRVRLCEAPGGVCGEYSPQSRRFANVPNYDCNADGWVGATDFNCLRAGGAHGDAFRFFRAVLGWCVLDGRYHPPEQCGAAPPPP